MVASSPLRTCAAVLTLAVPVFACATSGSSSPFGGGGAGGGGGSGGGGPGGGGDDGGFFGFGPTGTNGDARATREARCDTDGRCVCFNIASIGRPGHTGFQAGMNGADDTNAFADWLNTQSSAGVDVYTSKPTI